MKEIMGEFGCVGVLMGGYSAERAISLKSGTAVAQALESCGVQVKRLDIEDKEPQRIAQIILDADIDIAFIALHGCLGEDGLIQSILERIQIPYTGSGVEASRRALNKTVAQKIFQEKGIDVAEHVSLSKGQTIDWDTLSRKCGGAERCVVKPAAEGSSIGVALVSSDIQLQQAMGDAFSLGDQILIERFIRGRELTVGVLGDRPLAVIEIRAKETFFNYKAKYEKGQTEYMVPAPLTQEETRFVQCAALKAHQALDCRDLSRVDFIYGEDGRFYCLEINTIPGFTETSLLPKAAAQLGIPFNALCVQLVKAAHGKKKEKQQRTACHL